jgi:hypothetical protein
MDCKHESAVKTCLRIDTLVIQGFLYGVFLSLVAVVLIPFSPLLVAIARWRAERGRIRRLVRVMLLPLWMAWGLLFGLVNPFRVFYKSMVEVREVARMEWANRWTTGTPKKPNGHPLRVRSEEEKERIGASITMGVVVDYNDEAREHGQGIDLEDE